jgi:hypothetical protein
MRPESGGVRTWSVRATGCRGGYERRAVQYEKW